MAQIRFSKTNLGPLGCLLTLAVVAALGWLFYKFYLLLWWAAPVFFLLALVIDWKVPAAWGMRLVQVFRMNPLGGLVGLAFAVVFFPFTALGMFVNTLAKRRIERVQRQFFGGRDPFEAAGKPQQDEYVDYEEIETRPKKGRKPPEPTSFDETSDEN